MRAVILDGKYSACVVSINPLPPSPYLRHLPPPPQPHHSAPTQQSPSGRRKWLATTRVPPPVTPTLDGAMLEAGGWMTRSSSSCLSMPPLPTGPYSGAAHSSPRPLLLEEGGDHDDEWAQALVRNAEVMDRYLDQTSEGPCPAPTPMATATTTATSSSHLAPPTTYPSYQYTTTTTIPANRQTPALPPQMVDTGSRPLLEHNW